MWPVPRVENVSVLPSRVPGTFRELPVFPDGLLLATKQLFWPICSPLEVDIAGTLETITEASVADGIFLFVPSILDINPGTPMLWMLPEEVQDKVVPNLGTTFIAGVLVEEMLTSEADASFGMVSAELLMNMTRDPGKVQVAEVVVVTFVVGEGIFGEGETRKTFWKADCSGVLLPGRGLFCGGFC